MIDIAKLIKTQNKGKTFEKYTDNRKNDHKTHKTITIKTTANLHFLAENLWHKQRNTLEEISRYFLEKNLRLSF